jgi:flavin-dependent dehydrogenase
VLAVGEAAGLVNPFTGEGIDYALESAELAAVAVLNALNAPTVERLLTGRDLRAYPRALQRRFRGLFLSMWALQHHGTNPWVLNRLFGRGPAGQALVDRLIRVCFSAAPPRRLLAPLALARLMLSRPGAP